MYDDYRNDRPGPHWGDYQAVGHDYDQLAADPTLQPWGNGGLGGKTSQILERCGTAAPGSCADRYCRAHGLSGRASVDVEVLARWCRGRNADPPRHRYDQLAADPTLQQGMSIPGLDDFTLTENIEGLNFIRKDVHQSLIDALNFTELTDVVGEGNLIAATAVLSLGGLTAFWVTKWVGNGYVVLLDVPMAKTGKANLVFATQPADIAKLAKGNLAIVDGPPALIQAAIDYGKQPPGPTPEQACAAAGGSWVNGQCVAGGGQPLPPPSPAGMPGWVLPVGVGVVAVAVLAWAFSK